MLIKIIEYLYFHKQKLLIKYYILFNTLYVKEFKIIAAR